MGKDLKGKELGKGISQRADGRYNARFTSKTGKRKTLYDFKLNELKRKLREAVYEDEHGLNGNGESITLNAWYVTWTELYKKKTVKMTTIYKNHSYYNSRVKNSIGKMYLQDIKTYHVQKFLNDLIDSGLAHGTVSNIRFMLSDMLDKAVLSEYIRKNPCIGVEMPKEVKKERRVLTKEEQEKFFTFASSYIHINVLKFAVTTGCRIGEVLGLKWEDCDFGTGIMFKISGENVYQRTAGVLVGYISLVIYFAYSIYLVYHSKKQGVNLNFFPVIYFVGPCFAGVVLQFLFYGITSSWVLVAVALIFVQMQSYAESLYMDELSGLYNRRYFNAVLAEKKIASHKSLYGIMMDVNDFKCINDNLGHSTGDKAICTLGNILIRSIPDDGMAIRYAGDEFIVLLSGVDTERVLATMEEINRNLSRFNESGIEPFHLSVSMGYTEFGTEDDAETFLMHMDEKMYEEKRKYHMRKKSAGLENKV